MPHPPEHLGGCRPDVQHLAGNAECLAQVQGVVFGVVGGGEPWHREGEDVGAGAAHLVHRLGCDEQGMGGVEASRDADDDLGSSDRLEATTQAVDLDVVGLVAVLGELVWLVRDEGEPVDGPLETDVVMGRVEGEGVGAPFLVVGTSVGLGQGVVVEGPLPHPLLTQQVEVDVSQAVPGLGGEPVGLGQQGAVLVDHRLAVPGQVGARLPGAGGRVDVGLKVARGRHLAQFVSLAGLSDGDRGTREVDLDDSACESGLGGRGHRNPQVLADFHMEGEVRQV